MLHGNLIASFLKDYIPSTYAVMTLLVIIVLVPLSCFRRTRPAAAIGFKLCFFGAVVVAILQALALALGSTADFYKMCAMILALLGSALGFGLVGLVDPTTRRAAGRWVIRTFFWVFFVAAVATVFILFPGPTSLLLVILLQPLVSNSHPPPIGAGLAEEWGIGAMRVAS